ncbi:MAG: hypothetical protein ACK4IT_11040, partial [Thioalkalivibrionaceae bacterium]
LAISLARCWVQFLDRDQLLLRTFSQSTRVRRVSQSGRVAGLQGGVIGLSPSPFEEWLAGVEALARSVPSRCAMHNPADWRFGFGSGAQACDATRHAHRADGDCI